MVGGRGDHVVFHRARVGVVSKRRCTACFITERPDGHDPCLGELPGVMNACCGHGDDSGAYVQLIGGRCVRGKKALKLAYLLKGAGA